MPVEALIKPVPRAEFLANGTKQIWIESPKIMTGNEAAIERQRKLIKEHHKLRSPGELLSSLGIHAWDSIEDLFLSSVAFPFTNIMLVGEAGSSKSRAAMKVLSAAFGYEQMRKVDTHIEDEVTLGICDVPDLAKGKMSTFLSDNSLIRYKGIVLDEFNRAREDQRKIYMPLLSDRSIMGHHCAALCIIGTMNPLGDIYNTEPLDLAAAERFQQVITVPEFHQIDEAHRLKILGGVRGALTVDTKIVFPEETTRAFRAALTATLFEYARVEARVAEPLIRYVDTVLLTAKRANPPIQIQSSRTGQYLVRNILRILAWRSAVYGEDPLKILEPMARKSLGHVSTKALYDDAIPPEKLELLHTAGKQILIEGGALVNALSRITNPLEGIAALCAATTEQIPEIDRTRLCDRFLNMLKRKADEFKPEIYKGTKTLQDSYNASLVYSDCLIGCLGLLHSQKKMTDAALVSAGQIIRDILLSEHIGSTIQSLTLTLLTTQLDGPTGDSPITLIGGLYKTRVVPESKVTKLSAVDILTERIEGCLSGLDLNQSPVQDILNTRLKFWYERTEHYGKKAV